jgi:Immunoglobulin domain
MRSLDRAEARARASASVALASLALTGCFIGIDLGDHDNGRFRIVEQPASQTVCAGQRASFAVGVGGPGVVSYQWQKNGVEIALATGPNYVTPPTARSDDGSLYTVRVCNPDVCLVSSPALLSVLPA